jgi:SAM-dependent methyltransferase
LSLDASPAMPFRPSKDPDEVLEGALCCAACGTTFPILSGVAILYPRPEEYLRRYHDAIVRDLDRHGSLSSQARSWLGRFAGGKAQENYGADFRFSQQFEDPWSVARAMTDKPADLYGPFADWLQAVGGQGPYEVLAGWAADLTREKHLVLDAGCGGGGLLARVAPAFAAAFGVDLSFLAVLLARRAVLHRPEAERSYYLTVRRGQEVERPLSLQPAEGAEFVVGDCCALPFPPGLFDAVCSSNVIDIAGVDRPLDEGARVLRGDGMLLLSDPFYFRDGEAPPGEPRAAVRTGLERRGFRIEAERDGVPWAWATYDRHWRLYFSYCAAARLTSA